MDSGEVARLVRDERVRRGWSMVELSERAGINRLTLMRLEQGDAVRAATVQKVLAALGVALPGEGLSEEMRQALRDIEREVLDEE